MFRFVLFFMILLSAGCLGKEDGQVEGLDGPSDVVVALDDGSAAVPIDTVDGADEVEVGESVDIDIDPNVADVATSEVLEEIHDAVDTTDSADEADGLDTLEESDSSDNCEVVVFDDTAFEAAMLASYDANLDGVLVDAETFGVKNINVWFDPAKPLIQSIKGIECFKELERLLLNQHEVTDLSPLAGLVNLEVIELRANKVTDLSPLAGLVNLKSLRVGGIFSDIGVLAGLPNLKMVGFESPNITDLAPLAALPVVQSLMLILGDQEQDFSPIAGLTTLKQLDIRSPSLKDTDVVFMGGMEGLGSLILRDGSITDVNPIASWFTDLNWLDLEGNQVGVVEPLLGLTLDYLNLKGNPIDCGTQYQFLEMLPLSEPIENLCPQP